MKIGMTSVFVNDPHAAFKVYTEVLGFVKRLYLPEMRLAIVASAEDPTGTGLLLEPDDHPLAKAYQQGLYGLGMPVITLTVPDLQSEYERLMALGVVFKKTPTKTDWGLEAIFDDTCGNFIQVVQM